MTTKLKEWKRKLYQTTWTYFGLTVKLKRE